MKLASPHVSTGRLLRESISPGTKLDVAAKHYFEAGDQVTSGVTNALVADRTANPIAGADSSSTATHAPWLGQGTNTLARR